jgi:HEAT repeat protein
VDTLIAILQDKNEYKSIRATAADALGALLDERASEPLLAALDDENAEVRAQAANALGSLKDAKAVDKLIALAKNLLEDAAVRAASVAALGAIGDKRAEPTLLEMLRSETGAVRMNAMTALGALKSTQAVPELIAILNDWSEDLDARFEWTANASARVKAAYALADIGDGRAAQHLANRLIDDAEYDVALKDSLKRNWGWEQFVWASRAFRLPEFVAPKLIARLADSWENWPVKAHAVLALGSCESPQVVPTLRERLADAKMEIRQFAALGVGEAKAAGLLAELVKISKGETESEKDVRRAATQSLGEIADPSTVPDLIAVLNDDANHEEIRRDAALALGKIGDDAAASALIERLQALQASQSAKDFRIDLMKGLAEAKNRNAESILKQALSDEDADIHFWAADALFKTTGAAQGYNWKG